MFRFIEKLRYYDELEAENIQLEKKLRTANCERNRYKNKCNFLETHNLELVGKIGELRRKLAEDKKNGKGNKSKLSTDRKSKGGNTKTKIRS